MKPLMLNQRGAAVELGWSVRKVRQLTKAGVLPVWVDPTSTRRWYPRLALEAWARDPGNNEQRGVA